VNIHRASSPQIERIDGSLVGEVSRDFALDSLLGRQKGDMVGLMSPEEFIDKTIGAGVESSWTGEDLLEKFLEQPGKAKHDQHLRYLAKRHLRERFPLRFSSNPVAFLFLLPGRTGSFFVLETFGTKNATYLWQVGESEDLAGRHREIQSLMVYLTENRRREYLATKPDGFTRITHASAGDPSGFRPWLERMERTLRGE